MPRYSLKLRPWYRIISPGLSSVPANRLPIMHRAGADGDRLGDVARVADAAVGDDRHLVRRRGPRAVGNRGDHRHADAGDDARGADRAGADADLDRVDAEVDQRLGRFAGRDVAGDQVDVRELRGGSARTMSSTPCEWPCAVSITSTSTLRGDERFGPLASRPCRRRSRRRRAAGRGCPCRRSGT